MRFNTWLRKQRDRSDSVGELARYEHKHRREFPPNVTTLTTLSRYLERHGDRLEHAGAVAWFEYRTKANRSANAGERSPPKLLAKDATEPFPGRWNREGLGCPSNIEGK